MDQAIIEMINISKKYKLKTGYFNKKTHFIEAVKKVNLSVMQKETLGIVGESGSGKSTLGKLLVGLEQPTEGTIVDYSQASQLKSNTKPVHKQMIFQNPHSSLNPKMSLKEILEEPLKIRGIKRQQREENMKGLLEQIGMSQKYLSYRSREFSGGQKQRIAIARALAMEPSIIVADEPVSALDVMIQGQILNLMKDIQANLGLTYVFISHDMAVVYYMCTRVAVMYLGEIVEICDCDTIYSNPLHPYTKLLIASVPNEKEGLSLKVIEKNETLNYYNDHNGCPFELRCAVANELCKTNIPKLQEVEPNHFVSCHLTKKMD